MRSKNPEQKIRDQISDRQIIALDLICKKRKQKISKAELLVELERLEGVRIFKQSMNRMLDQMVKREMIEFAYEPRPTNMGIREQVILHGTEKGIDKHKTLKNLGKIELVLRNIARQAQAA